MRLQLLQYVGMVDIDDDSDQRYEVKAKRNIRVTHFRFKKMLMNKSGGKMIYDIALLELERPVTWKDYPHIRPICLPDSEVQEVSGLTGTVAGWGATRTLEEVQPTPDHCKLHRPITDSGSGSNSLKYFEGIR